MEIEWTESRVNQYTAFYRLESRPAPSRWVWHGKLRHSKSGKCKWETFGSERAVFNLPNMSLEDAKETVEAMVRLEG